MQEHIDLGSQLSGESVEAGAGNGAGAATGAGTQTRADQSKGAQGIAGLPILRGLVLYAAIFTFAGLYIYFIAKISTASAKQPTLDGTLVTAAALLAGVLGSAFALEIGIPTDQAATNQDLGNAVKELKNPEESENPVKSKKLSFKTRVWIRRILSLDPPDTASPSIPKTLGIWLYAVVASAVAVTYVFNQNQTPAAVKALAVAFAGYVIALVRAAYKAT